VRAAARAACENLKLACPKVTAPGRASFDWSLLASIPGDPVAWITTNRGLIFAELYKDEAPFTVDAFIRLARSGFYDGLSFHRVVPNFVVQGGDPMGDGCGGPPFSLRSEFSQRTFTRGSIGMASSGKDTEGSQFFVMHSSAPHLDGRYTLFGTVLDGMDVVDRLMPGDRILSIVVRE
jgi:peptidylprolyl isomerase